MSIPFSAASFRTAGVALTSERSARSAVAVGAVDEEDEADIDAVDANGAGRDCGGTDSDVEDDRWKRADAAGADEGG